jgi:hypothetical protein
MAMIDDNRRQQLDGGLHICRAQQRIVTKHRERRTATIAGAKTFDQRGRSVRRSRTLVGKHVEQRFNHIDA